MSDILQPANRTVRQNWMAMAGAKKQDIFTRFTSNVAKAMGHAWVFVIALAVLVVWALSGPLLGFSDTWQLIINTSTTIITFLVVFIIQNTQNRDNLALNIKLDAMLEKMGLDKDKLLEAEEESDKKLEREKKEMQDGRKRTK
jgi:low affinity Fe/Cu permease